MQSVAIIGEAIEGDLPVGVLDDACVELVDIICVVPCSPLYGKDGNVPLLLSGLLVVALPGNDFDWGETSVLSFAVLARMFNDLLPRVLDGLFFLPQLSQDVCEVDQ